MCFHPVVYPGRVKFSFCKLSIVARVFSRILSDLSSGNQIMFDLNHFSLLRLELKVPVLFIGVTYFDRHCEDGSLVEHSLHLCFFFCSYCSSFYFYSNRSMFVREVFAWMGGWKFSALIKSNLLVLTERIRKQTWWLCCFALLWMLLGSISLSLSFFISEPAHLHYKLKLSIKDETAS